MEPSLKTRRLLFNIKSRPLTPLKYGNLVSFPSSSFNFHGLFNFQGISDFIGDYGYIYLNLVKYFYANLSIGVDCIPSSYDRNKLYWHWKNLVLVWVFHLSVFVFVMVILMKIQNLRIMRSGLSTLALVVSLNKIL